MPEEPAKKLLWRTAFAWLVPTYPVQCGKAESKYTRSYMSLGIGTKVADSKPRFRNEPWPCAIAGQTSAAIAATWERNLCVLFIGVAAGDFHRVINGSPTACITGVFREFHAARPKGFPKNHSLKY